MARAITIEEFGTARKLGPLLGDSFADRPLWRERYEAAIDKLIALARPEMLEAWKREQEPALFDPSAFGALHTDGSRSGGQPVFVAPESPPAPRSPGAAGGAAGPDPQTGGALITSEGLLDALTALHADLTDGHFQINLRDWPGEVHHYIMRHTARQSEAAEAAE
jgi:hypothetical protein